MSEHEQLSLEATVKKNKDSAWRLVHGRWLTLEECHAFEAKYWLNDGEESRKGQYWNWNYFSIHRFFKSFLGSCFLNADLDQQNYINLICGWTN